MKDLKLEDDEDHDVPADLKSHLEQTLLLNSNKRNNGGGSSSSLDSKGSKGSNKAPTIIEDDEKKWFKYSQTCDLPQLKKLLDKDEDLVNKKDYFTGFAAIHWAAKNGRVDVITWLYDQKAEVNIRTNGGYSPLHIATIHKQEGTIHKLINTFDADINSRDYSGKKPRHYLSPTLSATVTRALQETPSVLELSVDPNSDIVSIEGYATPTAVRRTLRKPVDRGCSEDTPSGFRRIRKKGIAISNSFRSKKKSHYVMKREDRTSPTLTPKWQRSPSVPDLIIAAAEKDPKIANRKSSYIEYSNFMNQIDPPDEGRQRKNSVSDLLVNGYAGLINDTKRNRKQSTTDPSREYSINTWI
jgi:ankyrin repeat protein